MKSFAKLWDCHQHQRKNFLARVATREESLGIGEKHKVKTKLAHSSLFPRFLKVGNPNLLGLETEEKSILLTISWLARPVWSKAMSAFPLFLKVGELSNTASV